MIVLDNNEEWNHALILLIEDAADLHGIIQYCINTKIKQIKVQYINFKEICILLLS